MLVVLLLILGLAYVAGTSLYCRQLLAGQAGYGLRVLYEGKYGVHDAPKIMASERHWFTACAFIMIWPTIGQKLLLRYTDEGEMDMFMPLPLKRFPENFYPAGYYHLPQE